MSGAESSNPRVQTMRVQTMRVHKIASVVFRLRLGKDVEITRELEGRSGNAIVVRALSEKRVYSDIELENGRMSKVFRGDVIVGALGRRRALRGFVGGVPDEVRPGDRLSVLNLGGVIGTGAASRMDIGAPILCEAIGMPVDSEGKILNVAGARIAEIASLVGNALPPVLVVSATSMSAGKTRVSSEIIHELSQLGHRIAGAKLTGVACRRDLISMEDHGAVETLSFVDAGYPSTAGLSGADLVRIARDLVGHLAKGRPDLIVLELGDGILGDYGVIDVLRDPEIRAATRMHIFCASDLVGAWGGSRFLREEGIGIDLFSGPCTDNEVGVSFIERELKVAAVNAFHEPERLAEKVLEHLQSRGDLHGTRVRSATSEEDS